MNINEIRFSHASVKYYYTNNQGFTNPKPKYGVVTIAAKKISKYTYTTAASWCTEQDNFSKEEGRERALANLESKSSEVVTGAESNHRFWTDVSLNASVNLAPGRWVVLEIISRKERARKVKQHQADLELMQSDVGQAN